MADAQAVFNQNILSVLGLQDLPEDRKLAILEKITDLVLQRVIFRILQELKEEDKEDANKIFSSGTDTEKLAFLQSKANFAQIVYEELIKVKEELTRDAEEINARIK